MTSYITCIVPRPFSVKYLNEIASLFPGITFTSSTPKILRSMTCEWCFISKKMCFTLDFNKEDETWSLMARIPAVFDGNRINQDGIKDALLEILQSWSYDCKNPLDIQQEDEEDDFEVQIDESADMMERERAQENETKSSSSRDDSQAACVKKSEGDQILDHSSEEEMSS